MSDYETFNAYNSSPQPLPQPVVQGGGKAPYGVGASVYGKGVRNLGKNQTTQQQSQREQTPFSNGKYIIDFYGSFCGPCQKMAPIFEELEKKTPGVTFVKVEIGEDQELSMSMGVQSVPTFVAIINGKEVDRLVGANVQRLQQMAKKVQTA
jgi:thioredoxin 1